MYCTLTPDEIDAVARKRTAAARLGYAVSLAYLRHPGRVREVGEQPNHAMLAFLADQVDASASDLAVYDRRPQTRREHIAQIMARFGYQAFTRSLVRELVHWLTPSAGEDPRAEPLAISLIEELRRRRILIPARRTVELIVRHAIRRAENVSPDYGRIHDHELVEAVQRIAGNGTGDTRWKVPGVLDWSTGVYNPDVEISRDTTTLYASDRDVFLFLVDDRNPIEAGKLPDGSPDLYFRGFYCWNSEVGAKTLGMASFYLRAVCQNRNLWGVEDFQEIKIRHSKYAASRFALEAAPALTRFANSSPQGFVNGIKAARQQVVARSHEDRADFLRKRGFSKAESGKIIEKVLMEEGRPPESIFDFVQGITRLARDKTQQDARLDMEGRAKKLLDRVG